MSSCSNRRERTVLVAGFLLFAAALFVVRPAEASRTRTNNLEPNPVAASGEAGSLLLESPDGATDSPPFGFADELTLLDAETRPGHLGFFTVGTSRYALTYARNNPLKYVDPDGKEVQPVSMTFSGGNRAVTYVDSRMVPRLQGFLYAARQQGISFTFNSVFRTAAQQDAIVTGNTVNTTGTSPHLAGLAVDINVGSSLVGTNLAGLTELAGQHCLSPLDNQSNDPPHFQAGDLITRGLNGAVDQAYKNLIDENQAQQALLEEARRQVPETFNQNVIELDGATRPLPPPRNYWQSY